MQTTIPTRSEVPVEHTWNLASIYATAAEWEAAFAQISAQLAQVEVFRGALGESPGRLADWFDLWQTIRREVRRITVYAQLDYSGDIGNQAAVGRFGRATTLNSVVQTATAFAEPELMTIGFDTLFAWISSEPRLAIYRYYVEKLQRAAPHIRSAEVEELLGQVSDPFQTAVKTHGILTDADLVFKPAHSPDGGPEGSEFEIGQGTIAALLAHPDRQVRRSAWENYADAHLAYQNTLANCLITGVKQTVFRARARRYGSALEAALAPYALPLTVFHTLIDIFRQNLPTWHRYWRLRRRALQLETLHEYDIKAPLTTTQITVPYAQAVDWVAAGMAPLGDEYVEILRRGASEERWVDIYPNKGKRSGAFSSGGPGAHPFILLNYNNDLFGMSVLAHELGHSLHSYYTWQNQPVVYASYSMFVAEVASNFNQALVRDHLLKTKPDPNFQIALIEEAMANFHRYFFIMPTLARFELELHQRVERNQPLNAAAMTQLMADLFAEGYGQEVALDRDRTGITWAEFSVHLYLNFYVFQYATGISGAHALAAKVLAGEAGAAERYLAFLKTGGASDPLEALRTAGVDMTQPEAVEQAFATLASYVERLEQLLGGVAPL